MTTITFTLNGRPATATVREGESLLEVLRERCGLTSMKDGCAPEGSCGACTVLVDGRAVASCTQRADRIAGHAVATLEGLDDARAAVWARSFVAAGASQCGFCSPGIVMKAEALLRRAPQPSRDEIAHLLAGHLCRCTGYVKIIDAIESAATEFAGASGPASPDAGRVEQPTARYRGRELALGRQAFVNDLRAPGMVHAAVRWSDHPRATIRRIDASRARAVPGVRAVATWRDVPGERRQGLVIRDWRQFVAEGETTSYVGDVLATVAADTRAVARAAAALIDVEYEVLDPVTDPAAALAPDAPRLHENGNVLSTSAVRRGDVDAALASAAHTVGETFQTPFIEHAFLEPESALAAPTDDGGIHVYSQSQGIWEDRRQIASVLGVPPDRVRVTQVASGGAFGAKEDLNVQAHAALLARMTGRPVLLTLSRRESIRFHAKRHPMTLRYTVGCDAEGRLVAVRARIIADNGAYASVGDKVLERTAAHACGAYRVPNVDIETMAVYTNNPPAGAMRGFGVPQPTFAIEGLLDRLAEKVGIDGWEIRWRNALDVGDLFTTGQRLGPGVGLKKTLLAVKDAYRAARYAGIACAAKNTGIGNGMIETGKAVLRVGADGRLTLFHSWTEMGQGVHTVLRQIACRELDLSADQIDVAVDTAYDLDTGQTVASRATMLGGQAVIAAARRLREASSGKALRDLAGREFYGEFVVDWTTKPGAPDPVTHFAYGWATQVVILDERGRLERVIAAHDVGKVLNPTLLEGQIEGAVHMGLGYALSEELVVEGGVPVNDSLKALGILHAADMPPVTCLFIEEPQPEGPYGAKGVAEIGLVPTAAAVAGALYAYDGVRRTRLPMTDSVAGRAVARRHLEHAG